MNAVSSEKRCPTSMAFLSTQVGWHSNLPRFEGVRPDHMQVESSSCCFPRELVSFVCHRELVGFDPSHITCSPAIRKHVFELGGITIKLKCV